MKSLKIIIGIFLLVNLYSCQSQLKSRDFTEEGKFTDGIEGPATDFNGDIYAVNYSIKGTIGKVSPDGRSTLFLVLPNGSVGNGIRFGRKREMYVADYVNHNILEIDIKTEKIRLIAHGPKANQPNDIAITDNGTFYASDPNWAKETGKLWKITKRDGFELLEENMGTTNGIDVSNDGKQLYVNESVQRKIWVYDIEDDGSVSNKKEFYSFDDFGLDGMRFHENGNLFVTRYGKGTVAIINPEGILVEEIILKGKNPTNLTFSVDYSKCYITVADRGCIEVVEL